MKTGNSPRSCLCLNPCLAALATAALTSFSTATAGPISQQAYLKASNTRSNHFFGGSVAVSGDTAVVGAHYESSNATGVNGDGSNNSALRSGAAYVFVRSGTSWIQEAYLKPSNTGPNDEFGYRVAISGDTIVISAPYEDSNAAGVNGNGSNNSFQDSGAAYVFVRNGTQWTQQAYLKASNPGGEDYFGWSVAISGDTIVVGAMFEDSSLSPQDGFAQDSGAAYVFVRDGTNWSQQAFLKSPSISPADNFGTAVAVSGDTIIVSAPQEDSRATGVNGNRSDESASASGAAFVFVRSGTTWTHQAYLKASNTEINDTFGFSLALSGDIAVVGSFVEASSATGVNGNQNDNSYPESGAAYVFRRNGTNWSQQAYLKASNTSRRNYFGRSVAVSGDSVVVGAMQESSRATGVNGDQTNTGLSAYGAAYVFVRAGTTWRQQAYLKASNAGQSDFFGGSVACSGDTVIVGASAEDSSATGVNGDQINENGAGSGATYVFTGICPACPQLAVMRNGNGGYFIRFAGAPDATYRLQRAVTMTGPWDTLATLTASGSGLLEFHDTTPLPEQAFYRTVQP